MDYTQILAEAFKVSDKVNSISIMGFNGTSSIYYHSASLTSLNLYCGENLKLLPTEINRFKGLTLLEIKSCPDLDFDTTFKFLSTLSSLRSLGVYGCKIKVISPEIGRLKNLTSLSLGNYPIEIMGENCFSTLPSEIGHLINLESLYLTELFNSLKSLPIEIAQLKKLQMVSLAGTHWPINLALIPNLKELDLTDARYDTDELKSLLTNKPNLRWLRFRESYVPSKLKDLFPNLTIEIEALPHDNFY